MIERAVDRGELDRAADPALVVDVSGTVSRPSGRSVVPQRSPSKYRSPVPVALHGSGYHPGAAGISGLAVPLPTAEQFPACNHAQ